MTLTHTTTWYLEMTSPDKLRPGREPDEPATVARVDNQRPEYSRFFYRSVGGNWYWLDRLNWTYEEWQHWTEQVETWGSLRGRDAGRSTSYRPAAPGKVTRSTWRCLGCCPGPRAGGGRLAADPRH